MKVEIENLRKIAHLARINIRPEEEEKLRQEMSNILTWVEKLKTLDTEGVMPLTHLTSEVNVLRKDEAKNTISTTDALKNAPEHDNCFFKVPKVLK